MLDKPNPLDLAPHALEMYECLEAALLREDIADSDIGDLFRAVIAKITRNPHE